MRIKVTWALVLLIGLSCKKENAKNTEPEGFENIPIAKPITPSILDEASGIADSKANPGYLWVQQDSGNPNDIALLSQDGSLLKEYQHQISRQSGLGRPGNGYGSCCRQPIYLSCRYW